MITGDYPSTADAIAGKVGLSGGNKIITAPAIEKMREGALRHRITSTSIFARILPQQKLYIVKTLQSQR